MTENTKCNFCKKTIHMDTEWKYDSGRNCSFCDKKFCGKCAGESCGYCSDPSGWKQYFCKEHEEPKCFKCEDIICGYCSLGRQPDITICSSCKEIFHDFCHETHFCH